MLQIKANRPPKKTFAIVNASSFLDDMLDQRILRLSRLSGYPTPNNLIARVFEVIDTSSHESLLKSLLKLRNIFKFASDALGTLKLFAPAKFALDITKVHTYITENASALGRGNLTPEDLQIVTYLCATSEMLDKSWILNMDTSADNTIFKISEYYESIRRYNQACPCVPTFKPGTASMEPLASLTATGLSDSHSYAYIPYTDAIEHVTSGADTTLSKSIRRFSTMLNNSGATEVSDAIQAEKFLISLAATRLMDHISALLLDVSAWARLVPPLEGTGQADLPARAESFEVAAALFHGLLTQYWIMRSEFFHQGYMKMDEWFANFPVLSGRLIENYQKLVLKYDILNSSGDIKQFYSTVPSYATSSEGNAELFFSEQLISVGLSKSRIASLISKWSVGDLDVQDLSKLKDPKVDAIVQAHAVDSYDIMTDVTSNIIDAEIHKKFLNEVIAGVLPQTARYLTERMLEGVASYGPGSTVDLKIRSNVNIHHDLTTPGVIEGGYLVDTHHRSRESYMNDFEMKSKYLYHIMSDSSIIKRNGQTPIIFDDELGQFLSSDMGSDWMCAYPGNLRNGMFIADSATLSASGENWIQAFIERITRSSFEMLKHTLYLPHIQQTWATFFSTFALTYSTTNREIAGSSLASALKLVEGYATPWGCTYSELETFNQLCLDILNAAILSSDTSNELYIQAKNLGYPVSSGVALPLPANIHIHDGLYITPLMFVPTGSRELAIGRTIYDKRYYYFKGDSSPSGTATPGPVVSAYMCSRSLVAASSLGHMSLFRRGGCPDIPKLIFDKLRIYLTGNVQLVDDLFYSHSTETTSSPHALPISVSESEWLGERLLAHIEYKHLGCYLGRSRASDQTSQSAAVNLYSKLIDKMASQQTEAKKDSTEFRANEADPTPLHAMKGDASSASVTSEQPSSQTSNKKKNKKKNSSAKSSSSLNEPSEPSSNEPSKLAKNKVEVEKLVDSEDESEED